MIVALFIGAIHKRRRQFFRIFDTPLLDVGSFLVLSVGNFDQFLTPPNCRRRLWMAPYQDLSKTSKIRNSLQDFIGK